MPSANLRSPQLVSKRSISPTVRGHWGIRGAGGDFTGREQLFIRADPAVSARFAPLTSGAMFSLKKWAEPTNHGSSFCRNRDGPSCRRRGGGDLKTLFRVVAMAETNVYISSRQDHRRTNLAETTGPSNEPFLDCAAAADVLASVHPKTVERRAHIRLKRAARGEHVERFRRRDVEGHAAELRGCLEAWSTTVTESLRHSRPALPDALTDLQQDAIPEGGHSE